MAIRKYILLASAGALLGGAYRLWHSGKTTSKDEEALDSTIDDSFPASDPPAWSSNKSGSPAEKKSGKKVA